MPRKKFDLIVFDWDGTLMDSAAAISESLQAACAELNLPVPDDTQARYVIGLGLTDAMKHILPDLPPDEYPKVVERYRINFLKRDGGTTLFRGAAEMIRDLVAGQEAVVRTARALFPTVDSANDEPTADLLTQRMQIHEKTAWMLRSLLDA